MAKTPINKSPLRVPPQNIESERALLGSILLRPDAIYDIIDIVSTDSFYSEKHRLIYKAMFEIFTKRDPIDLISLSTRLKETKTLERIGSMSYLAGLVEVVPSSMNAKFYAEQIQKKYIMRRLIEVSQYIAELGFSEDEELDQLLDKAEKRMFEITSSPTNKKFIALTDILGEAFERLDTLHKSTGEIRGISTGFEGLDNKLAGLQKEDLIILAARPSAGKTALALDIARQTAVKHGNAVGIFSLEMSSQQLVDRMIASEAQVDAWRLRTGKLQTDDEFERIRGSLDSLSRAPIYIDDQPANNILNMRSVARRLKSEKGLDLIIVDYLQLMIPSNSKHSDSMVQQVTEISRSLKQLAREIKVPVIALSQLSRAIETRRGRPQLSDLRDSGSIEQDADVVLFIHNEDRYKDGGEKTNINQVIIAKHRNGPTGQVELYFDDKKASFRSMPSSGAVREYDEEASGVEF
jgi:replicative DNA helicase